MMPTFFTTKTELKNLLFNGLNIRSEGELVGACAVIALATFGLEGLRVFFLYLEARVRQHPLTYGQTDVKQSDTAPLFSSLSIPSSMQSIRKRRLKYHCYAFLTHVVNVILAFLIMLAVMSYNVWIGVSVLVGAGLGEFVFGTYKIHISMKYAGAAPVTLPSDNNSSVQVNAITETPDIDLKI